MFPTSRIHDQRGFTLIELLTTTTIIGLLAAIGIPSFTAQKAKAHDTEAIVNIRTAVSTIESLRTGLDTYDVTLDQMFKAEDSLRDATGLTVTGTASSFSITIASEGGPTSGGTFTFTRSASGQNTKTCANAGKGRCGSDGTW